MGLWVLGVAILTVYCPRAADAVAVTIHKTDDTTVAGELTGAANGKLIIATKPTATTIAIDEISQVVLREAPVLKPLTPPPSQQSAPDSSGDDNSLAGAMLNAFFGSGHSPNAAPDPPLAVAPAIPQVIAREPATTTATTQPAMVLSAKFTLADGDILRGNLQAWSDQKLTVRLSGAGNQSIEIPSIAVTEVWAGTPDLIAKARALTVEVGPEDVAFVQKDADVVAVKGLTLGVDHTSLLFRFSDQDRKIGLSKVVGLLLRGNAVKPIAAFHQLFKTDSGDSISGTWTGLAGDSAVLATPFGASVKLPLSTLYTIDCVNGRVVYVSDLTPSKIEQTPYFSRLIPYQLDRSLTGGPLTMSDATYSKGIAVHSRCVLEYDIAGNFDRFKTKLGFEDPAGRLGRVSARVLGDGKVLYENPDARGDQKPNDVDVDMSNIHTLTLEVDFGKDQDVGDRVIWAMPRLLRARLP